MGYIMGLNYYAIAVEDTVKEMVSTKWAKECTYNRYKHQTRNTGKKVYAFPVKVDDFVRYNHGTVFKFIKKDDEYELYEVL